MSERKALVATPPSIALTTALHLAEMQPPALANTIRLLDTAEQNLEVMSGICGILRGLALLRAKEVIAHGNFTEWVLAETGKTDRLARYEMRVAEGFLAELQKGGKGKTETRFRFDGAEQMLLEDFAAGMAEVGKAPLDERNPVVAAVAGYVNGRSMRTMIDALPALPRGGARTKSAATATSTEDMSTMKARDMILLPVRKAAIWFHKTERASELWTHLTPADLHDLDDMLMELRAEIKPALKNHTKK